MSPLRCSSFNGRTLHFQLRQDKGSSRPVAEGFGPKDEPPLALVRRSEDKGRAREVAFLSTLPSQGADGGFGIGRLGEILPHLDSRRRLTAQEGIIEVVM